MQRPLRNHQPPERRAPYGARGLKYPHEGHGAVGLYGRAPYGARGLKCALIEVIESGSESRPVWGAWIEISTVTFFMFVRGESRPVWGAWIEIIAQQQRSA